jgi:hypothetical protein
MTCGITFNDEYMAVIWNILECGYISDIPFNADRYTAYPSSGYLS